MDIEKRKANKEPVHLCVQITIPIVKISVRIINKIRTAGNNSTSSSTFFSLSIFSKINTSPVEVHLIVSPSSKFR